MLRRIMIPFRIISKLIHSKSCIYLWVFNFELNMLNTGETMITLHRREIKSD